MPSKFIPQGKILRVFTLMNAIAEGKYTVGQLADKLSCDPRTVYRYFVLLEEIGFCVDQDNRGRYFMCTTALPEFLKPLQKAIQA